MINDYSTQYKDESKVMVYYEAVKHNNDSEDKGIDFNVFTKLKSLLPYVKNKAVLDIGCGDGRWLTYLSKQGAKKCCGVDNSPAMIKKAKSNCLDNLLFTQGDMQDLPYSKNSFDFILSTFSLMYFEAKNLKKIASEINRTLKRSGLFYISTNLLSGEITLENQPIPLELGLNNNKFKVNNLYQSEDMYDLAFACLNKKQIIYFNPEGVSIQKKYKKRHPNLKLSKAIIVYGKCEK